MSILQNFKAFALIETSYFTNEIEKKKLFCNYLV